MLLDTGLRATLVLVALSMPAAAQGAGHEPAPGADKPAAGAKVAPPSAADAAVIAAQKPTYPMNSCVACGKIWGPEDTPLDVVRQGRLVRLCRVECIEPFDAQAAKWFKVIDDMIIAAQSATYPLTQCVVTGEELSKKPKFVVVGTRLVKVCCGDCKKEVLGDPAAAAAALAKIDAGLIAAQSTGYPSKTCLVDDKPLGEAPVQQLYGVTLVRFCSGECEANFKADPQAFSTQLDALRRSRAAAAPKPDAPEPGEAKPGH